MKFGAQSHGWSELGPIAAGPPSWAHHGIAVLPDGSVVTAHPDGNALVVIPTDGPLAVVPVDLGEMHGLTVVVESGRP